MRQDIVNAMAAEVVQRGVYAALDLNNNGPLGQHIGCAFEVWRTDYIQRMHGVESARTVADRVQAAVVSLGFTW